MNGRGLVIGLVTFVLLMILGIFVLSQNFGPREEPSEESNVSPVIEYDLVHS